jgi:hypothetical protein
MYYICVYNLQTLPMNLGISSRIGVLGLGKKFPAKEDSVSLGWPIKNLYLQT